MISEEKKLPEEENVSAWDYDYDDEYAFWEEVVYNIPTIEWDIWATANQWKNKETRSSCTMVWAISQIQRLFQIPLTMEERNKLDIEIVNYCVKNGWYVIWEWRSTPTACKYVCKWWNEIWYKRFNKEKVFYLRLLWNSPLVLEALSKWHLIWYTKNINFASDQAEWYVWRDKYPKGIWHRLNLKGVEYVIATGWAERKDAKYWSEDNYHWQIWENFFIEDLGKYINKWVYAYVYIILPESAMDWTTEEEKKRIEETKAINAIIANLTTTYLSVPWWVQEKSAEFAKQLREEYEDAMPIIWDEAEKSATAVVNTLSYNYKFVPQEFQEMFANLAKELREKFNIKKE